MEHAQALGQYFGYMLAGLFGLVYAFNRARRDTSSTALKEKTDEASIHFVGDLVDDHRRLVAQLQEAHKDRTANAEKIGALTAEVTILRTQVQEVRELLETLSVKAEEATVELHRLENTLLSTTMERDKYKEKCDAQEAELTKLRKKCGSV